MTEQDNILNQFEKVLQTLNTISAELQLDLIKKFESKLNDYKNSIETKRIDCNSSKRPEKVRKSKSLDSLTKSVSNSGINQNSVLNVRKSVRIFNRKTLSIGSKAIEVNKQQIRSISDGNINQKVIDENSSQPEEQALITPDQTLDGISVDRSCEEDIKPVVRRKWRRTKDINELMCRYCGKIWRSVSHLEIHLRKHTGEKIYECQQCGQRFAQLSGLQVHQRRHTNDRRFGCDICVKRFFTKIDLTRHKSSHKELKRITHCCEICGKGFSDNRKLKNHIRFVHEKKETVVCELCGHITHGQHLLDAHKRVKHGEPHKYACPVCNAVIGSRSSFVVHLRTHADLKPCACDICGRHFRSSSQVARHKLTHTEGRHECNVCSKKFKTPFHMRRHQAIHSGDKPFGCHLCEYKCNFKSNVVKHVKAVHGVVDFSTKQKTQSEQPLEEEAIENGTAVTEQVLKEISDLKGKSVTLNELKRLDEKKKKQKEIHLKQMSKTFRNRKHILKHKSVKKDILDDAIASTINDYSSNTGPDSSLINKPYNISIDINTGSHLTPVIIQNSSQIIEVTAHPTVFPKADTCSEVTAEVNSSKQFKEVIVFNI